MTTPMNIRPRIPAIAKIARKESKIFESLVLLLESAANPDETPNQTYIIGQTFLKYDETF